MLSTGRWAETDVGVADLQPTAESSLRRASKEGGHEKGPTLTRVIPP